MSVKFNNCMVHGRVHIRRVIDALGFSIDSFRLVKSLLAYWSVTFPNKNGIEPLLFESNRG